MPNLSSKGASPIVADEGVLREGAIAIESRRPDLAERLARDVLTRQPQHPRALHLLGIALLARERARDAVLPLEQALHGRSDPAVETHLGKALRHAGRTAEALTWLERAAAHEPPFPGALHELGILLHAMRRFDAAEAAFKRGLLAAPTSVDMMIELGGIHITRADPASAKIMFARALAHAPGHPRALHGFGTALLYEGDFERAAERFRQALARNPAHARAQLDLAHCLLELGRWDEAVAGLRGLNRRAPALYGKALKTFVSSGHGRFLLRPTAAAAFINSPATGGDQAPP